ncbi:orotate phosphoribosyltransferase [Maritalea sp.]|uniref:orotate phosphoribosyltransferase n=1 Tax=Maritalea sp. TaxID=2003361 RepID=UPI003EF45813
MPEFKNRIIDVCKLTGEFTTRSGLVVNTYFDKYQFEGQPDILGEIARRLARQLNVEFDVLAGLEMGGIPIATALSLEMGKPVCFVRKQAKSYGTERISEGPDVKNKRVLVVEDVTTTGGQILKSAKELEIAGAQIVGVALVIARDAKAVEAIKDAGMPLFALIMPKELNLT